MAPRVSVIIPTYNRAHLIGKAIQSVLNQTYQDFEIIVVDDGSTDNTRELVSSFCEKVVYIYQENKERSAARNNGMKMARGEYIAFLDSDDLFLPDKLKVQVELMDKNPDFGMSYSYSIWLDENGKYLHTWKGKLEGYIFPQLMLTKNTKVTTPSVMIQKSILEKVGYFNEEISTCEDYEFWCRIAKQYQVLLIKKSLVIINTFTTGIKESFENYLISNIHYYESVFKLDSSINILKRNHIFLDLFIKYYSNSRTKKERKYVSSLAFKISRLFPFLLVISRFFNIARRSVKKYNGIITIIRFFKNYIFNRLPTNIPSEEMEYGIIKKLSKDDQLLLIKKCYTKNESNNNYVLAKNVDRTSRKMIINYLIDCNYLSSNLIASVLKIN